MWDFCWTKWLCDRFFSEFFLFLPVDIILPWFSMLKYHLGDEQQASWWPRLDFISTHQHEQNKPNSKCQKKT
jgi:hypothetical protein